MKRTICFLLLFILISLNGFAYNPYHSEINTLQELGILNELKWDETSFITRRDMVDIVYCIARNGRDYLSQKDFPPVLDGFVDIAPEDVDLVFSACTAGILKGREEIDGKFIDFDSLGTYQDGVTFVARLFMLYPIFFSEEAIINSVPTGEDPYFYILEHLGIINSRTIVDSFNQTITDEQKNQPMKAYDFFDIVCRALYAPVTFTGYGGIYTSSYINRRIHWPEDTGTIFIPNS